jgi:hypothetical protein
VHKDINAVRQNRGAIGARLDRKLDFFRPVKPFLPAEGSRSFMKNSEPKKPVT